MFCYFRYLTASATLEDISHSSAWVFLPQCFALNSQWTGFPRKNPVMGLFGSSRIGVLLIAARGAVMFTGCATSSLKALSSAAYGQWTLTSMRLLLAWTFVCCMHSRVMQPLLFSLVRWQIICFSLQICKNTGRSYSCRPGDVLCVVQYGGGPHP